MGEPVNIEPAIDAKLSGYFAGARCSHGHVERFIRLSPAPLRNMTAARGLAALILSDPSAREWVIAEFTKKIDRS